MPRLDIQALNGLPPKPSTKTKHWNQAMFELKKYGENIEAMRESVKDKSLKALIKDKSSKSGHTPNSHNHNSNPQKLQNQDQYPIANNNAAVVEMDLSDGGVSEEVSSPGSPPSLQIDLEGSGSGHANSNSLDKSPNKGRAMPSGGRSLIGTINRNSQVPGSLDFNSESGPQAVVMGSPSSASRVKAGRKGLKAGAALSALVSTLAQRKRVAEMVGQVGVPTPVHQGAVVHSSGGGTGAVSLGISGGQDDVDTGKQKEGDKSQDKNNSPFSSIYEYRNKTAIALVDPNQKRPKRKTTKGVGNEPPVKKARLTPGGTGLSGTASGKPDGDQSIGDPAAYVAKIQEFSNAAISALNNNTSTNGATSSITHPAASNLKVDIPNVRASMSASPQNTSGSSNNSGTGTTPVLPGLPKSRVGTGGKKKAAKKAGDKSHGKSPNKGVVKGNGSNAVSKTTPSIVTSSMTVPSTASTASSRNNLTLVSQGASSSRDSPGSSGSGEVRGEIVAPGMSVEESSDFSEGTGLLADTIRKVNTSFMARVNQMTGSSDDMGYKYFVEKVSQFNEAKA